MAVVGWDWDWVKKVILDNRRERIYEGVHPNRTPGQNPGIT
jgi:hypothetical protein